MDNMFTKSEQGQVKFIRNMKTGQNLSINTNVNSIVNLTIIFSRARDPVFVTLIKIKHVR